MSYHSSLSLPKMPLEALPNELLSACFSNLTIPEIKSVRLVSKRLHSASSPFLISKASVSITPNSFTHLEALSNHPIFSKSITKLSVDVSYYDTLLAESLGRFALNSSSNLYQRLERMERRVAARRDHNESTASLDNAFQVTGEWDAVAIDGFQNEKATAKQKLILTTFEEYVRRFKDQEEVKRDGAYVTRLVDAISKFTALRAIVVLDYEIRSKEDSKRHEPLSEQDLISSCLDRSQWKGTWTTGMDTSPPTYIISDLFTTLAKTDIRPKHFDIRVTAPANLRCLSFSEAKLSTIRTTLSRATHLYFFLQRWARKDSYAENNDRPVDEMVALCTLTTAYFSSFRLEELHLSLDDYPCFYEIPTVSLSKFLTLPLQTPALKSIYFRNVPTTLIDLKLFASSVRTTLTSLRLYGPYLLSGSWVQALDVLREFEHLHYFELHEAKGMEFGNQYVRNPPNNEMHEYVLREREANPLSDIECSLRSSGIRNWSMIMLRNLFPRITRSLQMKMTSTELSVRFVWAAMKHSSSPASTHLLNSVFARNIGYGFNQMGRGINFGLYRLRPLVIVEDIDGKGVVKSAAYFSRRCEQWKYKLRRPFSSDDPHYSSTPLTFLALITGFASAADICRTTGSSCSGTKVCCNGIQEGNCCNLGTARSELLWSLPADSRFQVWSGTDCNKGNSGTFKNPNKVTNKCIGFSYPVPSAKWLKGGGTKRDVNEPCVEPNVAIYEVDGAEHVAKIPAGSGVLVEEWIEEEKWDLLEDLEI
ncbi:uncharacterized protein BDR25DRAFT_397132 [Lindgomyces ingoldianus]|uniref:Uncharacterized protein n=1 Tax=Lindgomyces ingoldianus TaxID=673940 RepID=A0ACB6Q923_9PLEO|nr:uncharacterized protein BDR25DRAFT_397132 [Lindgomyces ingoldianus]KAF2463411.1 hypothetical protein BDR25DRAFT_397132 [Lindgomyces ingoldianus]